MSTVSTAAAASPVEHRTARAPDLSLVPSPETP